MYSTLRSALPIVVVTLVATGVGLLTEAPTDQTGGFPLTGVLFAAMIGLVGGIQQWQLFPWRPTFCVAVAATGYLRNDPTVVNVALLAAGLAVIWHAHLRERRHRREHPQARRPRTLGQQDA
jgi:hypothetical protein